MQHPAVIVLDAIDAAEEALTTINKALREAGVDMAESNLARRVRRISEDLGEVRDEVENNGLDDVD